MPKTNQHKIEFDQNCFSMIVDNTKTLYPTFLKYIIKSFEVGAL